MSFSCSADAYFYNIECNNTILLHKPAIVLHGIAIVEHTAMPLSSLDSRILIPTTTMGETRQSRYS